MPLRIGEVHILFLGDSHSDKHEAPGPKGGGRTQSICLELLLSTFQASRSIQALSKATDRPDEASEVSVLRSLQYTFLQKESLDARRAGIG